LEILRNNKISRINEDSRNNNNTRRGSFVVVFL
jgi:hypothetical protein